MSRIAAKEGQARYATTVPPRALTSVRARRFWFRICVAVAAASPIVGCSDSSRTATPTSPVQPTGAVLDIPFVAEQKQPWCWAAVTEMILTYYGRAVSQCEIASEGDANDEPLCCDEPTDCGDGKSIFGVKNVLHSHGIESEYDFNPQQLSTVKAEILAGRPVVVSFDEGIEVNYDGSFPGHSALIFGFTSEDHLLIHDPHFGTFVVPAQADLGYAPKTLWNESLVLVAP